MIGDHFHALKLRADAVNAHTDIGVASVKAI